MNNEDFFEDLAKEHPEIMERANIDGFTINSGWNNIISTLFKMMDSDLYNAKCRLKAAIEYPRDDDGTFLRESEAALERALAELPIIQQVKEKYGTLRFYIQNGTEKTYAYIDYAEAMSACTCEQCGAPGELDTMLGWYKTLCKEHRTPDPAEITVWYDSTGATDKNGCYDADGNFHVDRRYDI